MADTINKLLFNEKDLELTLEPDPPNQENTYTLTKEVDSVSSSDLRSGLFLQLNIGDGVWGSIPEAGNSITKLDWEKSNPLADGNEETSMVIKYTSSPFFDSFSEVLDFTYCMLDVDTFQQILYDDDAQ